MRVKWLQGLIFVALFVFPFILQDVLHEKFGAEQWLSYFGVFGSILVASLGVKETLNHQYKETRQQREIDEKPIMAFQQLIVENKKNPVSDYVDSFWNPKVSEVADKLVVETKGYQEKLITKEFVILSNNGVHYKEKLDDELQERISSDSVLNPKNGGEFWVEDPGVRYIPMRLFNVGKGSAVNIMTGVVKNEVEQAHLSSWMKTLYPGQYYDIGIVVDDRGGESICGEYCLVLLFNDVAGRVYVQHFSIIVSDASVDVLTEVKVETWKKKGRPSGEDIRRCCFNKDKK